MVPFEGERKMTTPIEQICVQQRPTIYILESHEDIVDEVGEILIDSVD
jgi:hypothetical protein